MTILLTIHPKWLLASDFFLHSQSFRIIDEIRGLVIVEIIQILVRKLTKKHCRSNYSQSQRLRATDLNPEANVPWAAFPMHRTTWKSINEIIIILMESVIKYSDRILFFLLTSHLAVLILIISKYSNHKGR